SLFAGSSACRREQHRRHLGTAHGQSASAHTYQAPVYRCADVLHVIRMAAHAHNYLLPFDKTRRCQPYEGRTTRLAAPAPRPVLYANKGSTCALLVNGRFDPGITAGVSASRLLHAVEAVEEPIYRSPLARHEAIEKVIGVLKDLMDRGAGR